MTDDSRKYSLPVRGYADNRQTDRQTDRQTQRQRDGRVDRHTANIVNKQESRSCRRRRAPSSRRSVTTASTHYDDKTIKRRCCCCCCCCRRRRGGGTVAPSPLLRLSYLNAVYSPISPPRRFDSSARRHPTVGTSSSSSRPRRPESYSTHRTDS